MEKQKLSANMLYWLKAIPLGDITVFSIPLVTFNALDKRGLVQCGTGRDGRKTKYLELTEMGQRILDSRKDGITKQVWWLIDDDTIQDVRAFLATVNDKLLHVVNTGMHRTSAVPSDFKTDECIICGAPAKYIVKNTLRCEAHKRGA